MTHIEKVKERKTRGHISLLFLFKCVLDTLMNRLCETVLLSIHNTYLYRKISIFLITYNLQIIIFTGTNKSLKRKLSVPWTDNKINIII